MSTENLHEPCPGSQSRYHCQHWLQWQWRDQWLQATHATLVNYHSRKNYQAITYPCSHGPVGRLRSGVARVNFDVQVVPNTKPNIQVRDARINSRQSIISTTPANMSDYHLVSRASSTAFGLTCHGTLWERRRHSRNDNKHFKSIRKNLIRDIYYGWYGTNITLWTSPGEVHTPTCKLKSIRQ